MSRPRVGEGAKRLVLLVAALYATMLVLDVVFWRWPPATAGRIRTAAVERALAEAGIRRDPRSKADVARALRSAGDVTAAPAMTTGVTSRAAADLGVLPLGGLANTTSVFCREHGPWLSYRTDAHGFRNPASAFERPMQVLVAGDSFAEGVCQPEDSTYLAVLRARWPASVTIGLSGNGPLAVLAGLREYLPSFRPRVVVWLYFEGNDLEDLERERQLELVRYLDSGYTQQLVQRREQVDGLLRAWVDRTMMQPSQPVASGLRAGSFLKLAHLREAIAVLRTRIHEPPCCDVPLLTRIVAQADSEVRSAGGVLIFAYLPRPPQEIVQARGARLADDVIGGIRALGIPVIDLRPDLVPGAEPTRYFRYFDAHLDVRGNALLGERLAAGIQAAMR